MHKQKSVSAKDRRYIVVHHLIETGRITRFNEIFDILPKSILATDLWMNNARFEKLRKNVSLFQLKDLVRVASLLEVDEMVVLTLIYNEFKEQKKSKRS